MADGKILIRPTDQWFLIFIRPTVASGERATWFPKPCGCAWNCIRKNNKRYKLCVLGPSTLLKHSQSIFLIIMRTSLVVACVKHCSVFFKKWWFREIIVIIINKKNWAILSIKYFEKELYYVSNEECSGSAFNFCRCRIVFTDFHIWWGFSEFIEIKCV